MQLSFMHMTLNEYNTTIILSAQSLPHGPDENNSCYLNENNDEK